MTDKAGSDRGPIFVGGSGRSGTTIVGRTLGLHPAIFSFPDEPKFLAAVPGNLIDYLHRPEDSKLQKQFERSIRQEFFRRWSPKGRRDVGICTYVDKAHYFRCVERFLSIFPAGSLEERYQQAFDFLTELYGPCVRENSAMRWCDDSPLTVLHTLDLIRIFPQMRFIHVIRDGRHVAQSYCRLGWCQTLPEALFLWYSRVAIGRRLGEKLPKQNYLEVSLSDLIGSPESELRRILDFVGEAWDPAMDQHRLSASRESKYRGPVERQLDSLFQALAGSMIEEFGWKV